MGDGHTAHHCAELIVSATPHADMGHSASAAVRYRGLDAGRIGLAGLGSAWLRLGRCSSKGLHGNSGGLDDNWLFGRESRRMWRPNARHRRPIPLFDSAAAVDIVVNDAAGWPIIDMRVAGYFAADSDLTSRRNLNEQQAAAIDSIF